MSPVKRVVVWDPNPFNTYGLEVARVIGVTGRRVSHVGRSGGITTEGVRAVRALPEGAGGASGLRHRIKYVLGILRFVVSAVITRPTVVVAWTNSRLEDFLICLIQWLGVKTVLINHNPVPSRDVVGWWLARLRRNASAVVVHDEMLTRFVSRRSFVVPHPAYFAWKASMEATEERRQRLPADLLFFGSLRADKGVGDLPALCRFARDLGGSVRIAVGRIPPEFKETLDQCESADLVAPDSGYLSDYELYSCLRASRVMVAPYTDVTASGTAMLAATMGLAVVSYRSRKSGDLSSFGVSVTTGDIEALVREGIAHSRASSVDYRLNLARQIDLQSQRGWTTVLTHVERKAN